MIIRSAVAASLVYAGIAVFLYFTGFFSFFVFIPLIVAYYLRGYDFCKKSALLFFVFSMGIRVLSTVLFLANKAQSESKMLSEAIISPGAALVYEVLYCMSAVIAVIVLLHARFAWLPRILIATFMLFLNTYAQLRYVQANFSTIVESSSMLSTMLAHMGSEIMIDDAVANAQNIDVVPRLFSIAVLFAWAGVLGILIFNWVIALLITKRILRFNLDQYLRYVYSKVIRYYSGKILLLFIISALAVLLLRNNTTSFFEHVYNLFGNIFVVLLLCYMIYGACAWYFVLAQRFIALPSPLTQEATKQLRSDWYFFFVCGIMIIPFVNTGVSALCIVMGIKKNVQHIKNAYAMRSSDESNSQV